MPVVELKLKEVTHVLFYHKQLLIPTLADINWLKKHRDHTPKHIENLEWVLKENLVDFEQTDVIELFQTMQGHPIHLMFIVDTIIWAP